MPHPCFLSSDLCILSSEAPHIPKMEFGITGNVDQCSQMYPMLPFLRVEKNYDFSNLSASGIQRETLSISSSPDLKVTGCNCLQ